MNRVERLAATLLLLREGPQTAGTIARHFDVSRRTVLRDMQSLYEMGVPLESRDGAGGGYRLPPGFVAAPLDFDAAQTFLLLLALDTLGRMADTPFGEARAALIERLRAALPSEHVPGAERLLDRVHIEMPVRRRRAPQLQALTAAVQARRWLRIMYRSADREAEHHIFPRGLRAENGFWYCYAYSLERGGERSFRVDRIGQLRQAGASYQRIAPPAPLAYDDATHCEVVVELSARGAALLESEPHLGELVERGTQAGTLLRFRCPPGEIPYYARLFGGLGPDVRVQAPVELRERLAALGRALIDSYQR